MEAKTKIFYCTILAVFTLVTAPAAVFAAEPVMRSGAMNYERADDEFAAAIVVDAATGKRLYGYQTQKKWPAASLTKLMSAMVVMDYHQPWSKIVATAKADEVGGGSLVVKVGSKMKVQDMFYASIVGSANNTTMSLARLSGLGVSGFVKKMNAKAKALGLKNTAFVEPTGLDEKNVTTAEEMAKLAQTAFTFPMIRRAAATMSYKFTVTNPNVTKTVKNTNQLLTLDEEVWVIGGKTGFIYESRYNLAVQMRPMAGGPQLVVVVLGSPTKKDSFASAKSLAKWAWRAYAW
jgi:D-alanyl-D-alanine endopeptidase (penicillin-binding protein 7)